MQIQSPSLKACEVDHAPLLPVFSDHDQIRGRVILDPSCSSSGRLVKGSFLYTNKGESSKYNAEQKSHVFLAASTAIVVSPEPPRSAFMDAFAASIRRRPSGSSLGPHMPPQNGLTPSTSTSPEVVGRQRSCHRRVHLSNSTMRTPFANPYPRRIKFNISFKRPGNQRRTPIIVQPERDFQSLDCSPVSQDSWLEMPLRADRPIPYRVAITLPSLVTFSRGTSIPFFVVFTTTPRSLSLVKEIASDATISVSLIQKIQIQQTITLPPTPPHTPTSSIDENELPRSAKLLKRVGGRPRRSPSSPTLYTDSSQDIREKPLPRLPMETSLSETNSFHSSMCIGFPKRPRNPCGDTQKHPSLATQHMLPDGLHKSKIPLNSAMLPSIDWVGISVKVSKWNTYFITPVVDQ
ncbi:vacuolar protein sorting-associated protein [Salix suchowensis]|nr:vacuolar protein sorting-associated protein [Salix suchowensis]